jgi:acetate CoA/acetoacetate CoA-transferase beta subunit
MVPSFLPEEMEVILHSENGIVGTGPKPDPDTAQPFHVVDAGGQPAAVAKHGAYIDSVVSFGIIRGGHLDATILGALEVDEEGNLSNWIIPGKKVPGMGGAMDLVVGAKKVIVAMEHTAKGAHKILKKCTLPVTAVKCVDMIITEMGVFHVVENGLLLTEYNPAFSLEDIMAATGCSFAVADDLKPMM